MRLFLTILAGEDALNAKTILATADDAVIEAATQAIAERLRQHDQSGMEKPAGDVAPAGGTAFSQELS